MNMQYARAVLAHEQAYRDRARRRTEGTLTVQPPIVAMPANPVVPVVPVHPSAQFRR